jgi:hypothetical protein
MRVGKVVSDTKFFDAQGMRAETGFKYTFKAPPPPPAKPKKD